MKKSILLFGICASAFLTSCASTTVAKQEIQTGKVDIDTIIEQYEELHSIKWESSELNHRKYPAYIDAMGTEELFANIKTGPGAVDYYKDQAAILRKFKFISEFLRITAQRHGRSVC